MLNKKLSGIYEANDTLIEEFDSRFSDPEAADNRELATFFERVKQWARESIDLGRFMPEESNERQALQGQLDYWMSLLRRHRVRLEENRLRAFDASASAPLDGECPYPGLRAYGSTAVGSPEYDSDIAHFLGRERDISTCLKILESHTLLSIVAGSGTGKSSLVLAGILPHFRQNHPSWIILPRVTPGSDPTSSLAAAFASGPGAEAQAQAAKALEQLAGSADADIGKELDALINGRRIVLFIDQFEELFSLCRDVVERDRYARILRALAHDDKEGEWPVRIITTMRTDHLSYLEREEPQLYALMKRGEVRPDPLAFADLKQVIEKPAKAVGLRFVPASIVDNLAGAAASLSAGLPLLQFALYRLWTHGRRDQNGVPRDLITQADVDKLPDVQRALSTAADQLYQELPESGRLICHRLMLELTEIADNSVDPLRRRRKEVELCAIVAAHRKVSASEVEDIIARFVDARLLVRSGDGDERQIEVAHEALFVHWETFRDKWLIDAKSRLVAIKTLERETAAWIEGGKREDLLKQKGEPLQQAKALLGDQWLSPDAGQYVAACVHSEEKVASLKAKVTYLGILCGFLFLVAIVGGVGGLAWWQVTQSRATANSALVAQAGMQDSLSAPDAIGFALNLSEQHPHDEGFTRALLQSKDRIANVAVLKDANKTMRFVSGWRAIVGLPLDGDGSHADKRVIVHLLSGEGTPIHKQGGVSFTPPDGFDAIALTGGGPAIGIRPDIRDFDDQLVWLAWTTASNGHSARQIRLQVFTISEKATQKKLVAETSLDSAQVGSLWLSDDGKRALVVALDPPAKLGSTPQSSLHDLYLDDQNQLRERAPSEECAARLSGKIAASTASHQAGNDVILVAAFLRSDDECPITARADGSVVCPSGYWLTKGSGGAPIEAIYPSPSGETFVTYGDQQALRLRQCAQNGADQGDWWEGQPPLTVGYLVKDVSFGNNSIYAITDRRIGCWSFDSNGRSGGGYPCFGAIGADEMALDPTGLYVWYVDDSHAALIRSRAVPDKNAGSADQEWFWALGGDVAVGFRNDEAGAHIESLRKDGAFVRIPLPTDVTRIMTASVSGDGKWLAYGAQGNSPGAVRVFIQSLGSKDAAQELKNLDVSNAPGFSLTRISVAAGPDNEPGIVLVLANKVYVRTRLTQWTPLPTSLNNGPDEPIRCLSASRDGRWLLIGTEYGTVARLRFDGGAWKEAKAHDARAGDVQACAIADNGTAVLGNSRGKVFLLKQTDDSQSPPEFEDLTALATAQFPTLVASVSIDPGGKFASALGSPQALNCTELSHPGQMLQIWHADIDPLGGHTPVARRCFVDAAFNWIDAVDPSGNIRLYPDNQPPKSYACPLCAEHSDPQKVRDAAEKELLGEGMQAASAADMGDRFGISTPPSSGFDSFVASVRHHLGFD